MGETPMSALTLLCSGIQLYSAEQRIADCILADVKRHRRPQQSWRGRARPRKPR